MSEYLPNPRDLDSERVITDYQWECRECNLSFGTFKQDLKNLVFPSGRHLIERRSGPCLWKRHKCISCKADADKEVAWIRWYVSDPIGEYFEPRLHEQCVNCHRTTSWPYLGVAPTDWKHNPRILRKRDVQKMRSYQWQWGWVYNHSYLANQLPDEGCLEFVSQVCKDFNIPVPEVCLVPYLKGLSSSAKGSVKITLVDTWGRCRWVMLHELGHIITAHLHSRKLLRDKEPNHGPCWVSVYCLLLERYGQVDMDVFQHASEGGLKLFSRDYISRLLALLRG